MNFHDFQIRAWQVDNDHIHVMVQSSPVGDMRRPVQVPCALEILRRAVDNIIPRHWAKDPELRQRVVKVGRILTSILLPRPVRTLLDSSLGRIPSEDGLRLRLCLDESLVDLPWEFLHRGDPAIDQPPAADAESVWEYLRTGHATDGEALRDYFVLDARISLVREAPVLSPKLRSSEEKQRLLFAAMGDDPGRLVIGAEEEYQGLSEGLKPVADLLAMDRIAAGEDQIDLALAQPTSIFHYSGATTTRDGRAWMGTSYRDPDQLLDSETLGSLLHRGGTRLAVFSADNSGQWAFVEPLLRAGLAALVGAQGILPVKSYIAFCHKLYSSLAIGLSLDEAVTWARLHVLEDVVSRGEDDYSWGGFMVYMPTTEAILFPRPQRAAIRERQAVAQRERAETIGKVERTIGPPPGRQPAIDLYALRKAIANRLNLEELELLCDDVQHKLSKEGFDYTVSLEAVGGEGEEIKVKRLIEYLERRSVLGYLVDTLQRDYKWVVEEYESLA